MLIVHNDDGKTINCLDEIILDKAHYASFDDLRWHRLHLTHYEIIILIPDHQDISYHLKYLRLCSNAPIVILSSKHQYLAKERGNIYCFSADCSSEFMLGFY